MSPDDFEWKMCKAKINLKLRGRGNFLMCLPPDTFEWKMCKTKINLKLRGRGDFKKTKAKVATSENRWKNFRSKKYGDKTHKTSFGVKTFEWYRWKKSGAKCATSFVPLLTTSSLSSKFRVKLCTSGFFLLANCFRARKHN